MNDDLKLSPIQIAIIEALREENNLTATEIAEKTGYRERQITTAFRRIVEKNLGSRYKDYYLGKITTFYKINLLGKTIDIL